jgi:hypothetical protein
MLFKTSANFPLQKRRKQHSFLLPGNLFSVFLPFHKKRKYFKKRHNKKTSGKNFYICNGKNNPKNGTNLAVFSQHKKSYFRI